MVPGIECGYELRVSMLSHGARFQELALGLRFGAKALRLFGSSLLRAESFGSNLPPFLQDGTHAPQDAGYPNSQISYGMFFLSWFGECNHVFLG